MARTRFQQYQVSGSLLADINDSLAVGSGLQGNSDITGDLNAIRTQLNKIIGTGHWYDALTGSQSLKVINDALVVNGNDVTFNDKVSVLGSLTSSLFRSTGDAVFQQNVNVQGQLTASLFRSSGDADFATNVNVVGQLTSSQIRSTGDAVFQSNVNVQNQLTASTFRTLNNANVDGQLTASYLSISGSSVFNGPVVFSGSVEIPSSFEIAGDMFVLSGTFDMSGSAYFTGGSVNVAGPMTASTLKITGDTEMSGNLKLESGDSLFIADLNSQEVLFAAAGGELTGSSKFLWNNAGSQLTVLGGISGSGNFAAGGTLTVAGASDLNGALDVAGQVDLAAAGVSTNVRGTLNVSEAAVLNSTLNVVGDSAFSGSVKVEFGESLFISDLNAQELVFAAAGGELTGSGKLLWDNSGEQLTVLGGVSGSGNFLVGGQLEVAGTSQFNDVVEVLAPLTASSMKVLGQAEFMGAVYFNGTMVNSEQIVSGNFAVSGNTDIDGGNLTVHRDLLANNLYDLNNDMRVSFVHGEDFKIFTDGGYAALTLDQTNGNVTLTDDLIFGGAGNSGSIRVAANNTDLEFVSTGKLFITASGQAFNFANSGEQALFDAQFPGMTLIGAMLAGGGNLKQAVVSPGNTTGGVDQINFSTIGYLRSGSLTNDTEKMNAMNVYLNGALLAYGASNDYEIIDTANIRLVSGIDTLTGDVMIISIRNAEN